MRWATRREEGGVGLPAPAQELLLRAALGNATSAASAWTLWRQENDLNNLPSDSRRLLPLVRHNLTQAGVTILEDDAISGFVRLGWAKNKLLFKSLREVAHLFNEHKVACLFIKGLPLALEYYPYPALRPMNDGDFLVRPTQFDYAVELLTSAGWQYEHALEKRPSAAHHALPLKNAAHQEVDLHRFALGECPFSDEDELLWQSALTVSLDETPILVPNPTDLLFMTCAHSVHSPIRWVADAILLLRSNEIDWPRLIAHARSRKLTLVTRNALSYIEQQFPPLVPPLVLEALQATPISWLEKQEYYGWERTDSQNTRLLLRYCAYRRIPGVQHPLGFLNYLRLHGNLDSLKDVPLWLFRRLNPKARSS